MKAAERQKQLIREELEAHIEDMTADFVAAGMDAALAREKAESSFGDMDAHVEATADVEQVLPSRFRQPRVLACIGYAIVLLGMLAAIESIGASSVTGQLQVFTLWWVFVGITGMVLLFLYWIIDYLGLKTAYVLRVGLLFTILASLSMTSVLDVDNFEVNVHAVIAGIMVYLLGEVFWKRMSAAARRAIIYAFGAVVSWSTLIEEPIFGFIGTARCLFITPDNVELVGVLAACEQVPLVGRATAPIILAVLLGAPYMVYFALKYWRAHGVQLSRKLIFTAGLVAMPVAPMIVTDVNNYGELDVIPQKAVIYETYMEILGRAPEDKDYLFYARTRAYENMVGIEEILYNSYERRLKINLLHLEYLGRSATKDEVDLYVFNRKSIEAIREELQLGEHSLLEELEAGIEPVDPQRSPAN